MMISIFVVVLLRPAIVSAFVTRRAEPGRRGQEERLQELQKGYASVPREKADVQTFGLAKSDPSGQAELGRPEQEDRLQKLEGGYASTTRNKTAVQKDVR